MREEDSPVWEDDEGFPAHLDEPVVLVEDERPTCKRCGHRNENTDTPWKDGLCGLCVEAQAPYRPCTRCNAGRVRGAETICSSCAYTERKATEEQNIFASSLKKLETIKREYEESPHYCAGGCGEKMLQADKRCGACLAVHEKERERRGRSASTGNNIPTRYKWASFEAPELPARIRDRTAIASAIRAAADAEIDRIVFSGKAGAGKTSLAVANIKKWSYDRGLIGEYTTARALSLARSQSGLGDEAGAVAKAIDADILLIDDLGLDAPQQYGSALLDVVYARHASACPTIITLAVEPNELTTRYGDGFGRRLLEDDGHTALVEVRRFGVVKGGAK